MTNGPVHIRTYAIITSIYTCEHMYVHMYMSNITYRVYMYIQCI